jgi:hypothetical protein
MGELKRGGLGSPSLIIFWLRSKSRRNNTKKRTTDRKVVRKLGTKKRSISIYHQTEERVANEEGKPCH